MSDGLDRALGHYAGLQLRSVEVPEWGDADGPLVVYWRPWTAAEKREVYKASRGDDFLLACRVVVRKALKADGTRLFEESDVHKLMRGAHDAVIGPLASRITADLGSDDEAAAPGSNAVGAADGMASEQAVEAAEKN